MRNPGRSAHRSCGIVMVASRCALGVKWRGSRRARLEEARRLIGIVGVGAAVSVCCLPTRLLQASSSIERAMAGYKNLPAFACMLNYALQGRLEALEVSVEFDWPRGISKCRPLRPAPRRFMAVTGG